MKTKTYSSIILLFIGLTINAQNKKENPIEGSWMGHTNAKDLSLSELVLFNLH